MDRTKKALHRINKRQVAVTCALIAFTSVFADCRPSDVIDAPVRDARLHLKPAPERSAEQAARNREICGLEAETARLRRESVAGPDDRRDIINVHEHLYHVDDLEKYLPAARAAGIASTVFLSSSALTLAGKGHGAGEPSMSENFEDDILPAAKKYPGEVIPFCTLDPLDPDALERLKRHVAMGAKGLKLISGHSNFHNAPLDAPTLDPVYSYLEATQLPLLWHVNYPKFGDELDHVLRKHPHMNMVLAHYGVCFWRANDGCLERLTKLMRAYPNAFVDTSLGTRQILTDGFGAMQEQLPAYRRFIDEFQDRVVWGTDTVVTQNSEKTPAWFELVFFAARDQLEKETFATPLGAAYSKYSGRALDGDGRYGGLALPRAILDKIYTTNAMRWLRPNARSRQGR